MLEYISYNSLYYIIFLLICVIAYYVMPSKKRWLILLISSLLFYMCAGVAQLFVLLATSLIIWTASLLIHKSYAKADEELTQKNLTGKAKLEFLLPKKKKCRNYILIPALLLVIGILCYYKFADSIINSISSWTGSGQITLEILAPLGISYYTFSSTGYLLDVYWRKQPHIENYFQFLLCMCFFPQIVQGPISRYNKLFPQFQQNNRFNYERFCFGLQLMLYGYFKKMVIADRLAILTTGVFRHITEYEGLIFPIALAASSFQIYMDFSGCMDIVRGTSQIFGINLEQNFKHPFFSKNTAEFWRRWHITLGTWFKDYVYMPIAMSPKLLKCIKKIKEKHGNNIAKIVNTAIPLSVVWILTGLWHGTGMNYIIWGFYYGVIIILGTILGKHYKKLANFLKINVESKGYKYIQMLRTFSVFTIGRLITAPGTLQASVQVLRQTFSCFNPWIFWDGTFYNVGLDLSDYIIVILGFILVLKVSLLQEKISVRAWIARRNIIVRWLIYYMAIFAILILGIYGSGYDASAFIYAQF